jgi:hypothetical protein
MKEKPYEEDLDEGTYIKPFQYISVPRSILNRYKTRIFNKENALKKCLDSLEKKKLKKALARLKRDLKKELDESKLVIEREKSRAQFRVTSSLS